MFEYDFPDLSLFNGFNLEEDIVISLKENGGWLLLKDLIVKLIQKYGISFPESHYKKVIKNMPVKIDRKPEYTPTGKKAVSMNYDDYEIRVSL